MQQHLGIIKWHLVFCIDLYYLLTASCSTVLELRLQHLLTLLP